MSTFIANRALEIERTVIIPQGVLYRISQQHRNPGIYIFVKGKTTGSYKRCGPELHGPLKIWL